MPNHIMYLIYTLFTSNNNLYCISGKDVGTNAYIIDVNYNNENYTFEISLISYCETESNYNINDGKYNMKYIKNLLFTLNQKDLIVYNLYNPDISKIYYIDSENDYYCLTSYNNFVYAIALVNNVYKLITYNINDFDPDEEYGKEIIDLNNEILTKQPYALYYSSDNNLYVLSKDTSNKSIIYTIDLLKGYSVSS